MKIIRETLVINLTDNRANPPIKRRINCKSRQEFNETCERINGLDDSHVESDVTASFTLSPVNPNLFNTESANESN